MTLDDRLHQLGDEAHAAARRLAEELQPPSRRPQQRVVGARMIVLAAVLAFVAILGLRATQGSGPVAQDVETSFFEPIEHRPGHFSAAAIGVDFWLPEQHWQVTGRNLTPNLDESPLGRSRYDETIISFSTFAPDAGSTQCHHLPEAAFRQLGPTDALVSVLEVPGARAPGLPERRRATGTYADDPGRFYRASGETGLNGCLQQIPDLGVDLGFSREYIFQDQGRAFEVRVGLGSDVPADIEAQAWRILDRLEFAPG